MKILSGFILFQTLIPYYPVTVLTSNSQTVIMDNNEQPEALAKRLQGHWYSAPYLAAIDKNQSIVDVKEFPTTALGLIIERSEENPQTLFTYGHGFTESGILNAVLKYDKNKNHFVNNTKAENTFSEDFTVVLLDDNTIELQFDTHKEVYKRVNDIQSFIRKTLMAGEFIVDENTVKLNESGRVENFKNYKYYTVDYSINNTSNLMGQIGADIVYFLPEKEASILDTDVYTMRVQGHKIILQKLVLTEDLQEHSNEIYKKDGAEIILMKK